MQQEATNVACAGLLCLPASAGLHSSCTQQPQVMAVSGNFRLGEQQIQLVTFVNGRSPLHAETHTMYIDTAVQLPATVLRLPSALPPTLPTHTPTHPSSGSCTPWPTTRSPSCHCLLLTLSIAWSHFPCQHTTSGMRWVPHQMGRRGLLSAWQCWPALQLHTLTTSHSCQQQLQLVNVINGSSPLHAETHNMC
jgi:hypothetical protein